MIYNIITDLKFLNFAIEMVISKGTLGEHKQGDH